MAEPDTQAEAVSGGTAVEETNFASLLQKEFRPKSDQARTAVEDAVKTLAQQALAKPRWSGDDTLKSIESLIAEIDKKLSEQVNLILHHAEFQQLESAWRGLSFLVNNTETDEMLKIRVMNISKKDLAKTLSKFKGTAWDQSPIFKKIYEEEFGQFGGEPFGCAGRRLLFRPLPAGRGAFGRTVQARRGRACPADHRRGAFFVPDGQLVGTGQSEGSDEDLPDTGIRSMAQPA